MNSREKLENFLEDLITPQNDTEAEKWKEQGFVDDYITLHNKIPLMSDGQLIEEINRQLSPFDLELKLTKR